MSLPRTITIDRWEKYNGGAYGVVYEAPGQAPILWEAEGCDTSFAACSKRAGEWVKQGRIGRWCIVRLVPVDGNELLLLDLERLQQFNKEPQE
jgi:hypothetical protein